MWAALAVEDEAARWMESYGLVLATVALVVATASLTWATMVMTKWMRLEFESKNTPIVVPFGDATCTKSLDGVVVSQMIANLGNCTALIEHLDVDVHLKRLGHNSVSIRSVSKLPFMLPSGESIECSFSVPSKVVEDLGGVSEIGELARVIDIAVHIRSAGPTRTVVERRWPINMS